MGNIAVHQSTEIGHIQECAKFSFFERVVLRRYHPISLFLSTVGLIWVGYFLWENQWQIALAVVIVDRLLAASLVWNADLNGIAESTLGKIGLLHLHPVNLVVQVIGVVGMGWALWIHSTLYILGGLSVLLLGHLFGWSKVHPSFSLNGKSAR